MKQRKIALSKELLTPMFSYKSLLVLGGMILVSLFLFLLLFMIPTQLSNFKSTIYSGPEGGWYHQLGRNLAEQALNKKGKLSSIETNGSVDNLNRVLNDKNPAFALVQGSLDFPHTGIAVIAKLPEKDMVYIAGKNLPEMMKISAFDGKKIGIGPKGSGTAQLVKSLLKSTIMKDIHPELIEIDYHRQIEAVVTEKLPFAIFVFSPKSPLIAELLAHENISLMNLVHCEAIAKRFSFLSCGTIDRGFFNPVSDIPPKISRILQTDILLIANDKVSNSDVVAMLSLLKSYSPLIIPTNRIYAGIPNTPFSEDARRFFDAGGQTLADRYIPWLTNFLPFAILLQIAMGIGILFKGAAGIHRFQLWRIDATRIHLEKRVDALLKDASPSEDKITEVIVAYDLLFTRTRTASLRMLVPMGVEMLYRYQEELIEKQSKHLKELLK